MSLRPLTEPIVRLCTLAGVVASLAACARGAPQTGATPAPSQPPPVATRDTVRPAAADTIAAPAPPRPAAVDTTPRPAARPPERAPARAAPSTPATRPAAPRTRVARGALGPRAGARHMA